MSRKYAEVQVAIWDNQDFVSLDADAQRLYFVLMTRAELNLAGTLPWHAGRLSQLSKDTTAAQINKAAVKLERARFIVIDRETDECLLRTQVRHDGVLSRGPKLAGGVLTAWRSIYSHALKIIVASEVKRAEGVSDAVLKVLAPMLEWASDTPCDTPSEGVSEGAYVEYRGNQQPATSNQDTRSPADADEPESFADWWKLYPRKVGKGQALKAYKTARKTTPAEVLLSAITNQRVRLMAKGVDFCPHPATWLNGQRWLDETSKPVSNPNGWMTA